MSVLNVKVNGSTLEAGLDTNKDGQNSVGLKLHVGEGLQEGIAALMKGEKKVVEVPVKKLSYVFENGEIKVSLDTDQDGEPALEGYVNMGESLEEIASGFSK